MTPTRSLLISITLAASIGGAATARADPYDDGSTIWIDDGDTIHVLIHPSTTTLLRFDAPIADVSIPRWGGLDFKKRGAFIALHPRSLPSRREIGSFSVEVAAHVVHIKLLAARAHEHALDKRRIAFRDQHESIHALIDKAARAHCADELTQQNSEISDLRGQHLAFSIATVQREIGREVLDGYESIPLRDQFPPDNVHGVVVRVNRWLRLGKYRLLTFDVENRDPRPFTVADVKLHDELGTDDHAVHAELKRKRDNPPPDTFGVLAPYERRSGYVMVHADANLGTSVTLILRQPNGRRTVTRDAIPTWNSAWQTLQAETAEEHRRTRGVSIYAQPHAGVMWLNAARFDTHSLGATSIGGLGLHVSKGINSLFAFEAGITAATTGRATFATSDTGALLDRRATLARLQLGGAMRFGGRIAPLARAFVGLQTANLTTGFATNDGATPVRESAIEFDALFGVGVEVTIRLTDHILVGPNLSGIFAAKGPYRALEAGIRVGYSL
jgi:hypothetical protein